MKSILAAALSKKADRPEVLDLRGRCSFTDYFVILSGDNHRQVQAIADAVADSFDKRVQVEGYHAAEWILIDGGDAVVHVFLGEKRAYYDLEGFWRDAERIAVDGAVAATGGGMH